MPGMGLGTRSYPPVRGAHRPDLLRIRPLESRRLGNLHVRFGGGRLEQGVCDVPRRPPTRLRKGSEPPNGGGGEEPGASAPGTVPAPLSPWESPAGATGVTVAPAGLLGREGGLGSPRSTRGCRPWLLTAAPPVLWEQTLIGAVKCPGRRVISIKRSERSSNTPAPCRRSRPARSATSIGLLTRPCPPQIHRYPSR